MIAPIFDGTFAHSWTAEILPNRPMILPSRHYVYPGQVEEVELGALEILVQPGAGEQPLLATCALGFKDPAAPSGIWAMPHPDWLCAISGGYAYLINVGNPREFTMLRYRPVLKVLCYLPDDLHSSPGGLLLFIGHHSILAWGRDGEAWESDRLSWEGVTIDRIEENILHGQGWDLMTDKDLPFALDLTSGRRV
ncbi:hypothetical protein [Acidicapsa ligni]|uniref:hypothetical protein n=1 Tax=Acidicapsa ligni TaxID=542300 RepID=UPI0021E06B10|nr:hypothetical protein [Acidicapsa ligni]